MGLHLQRNGMSTQCSMPDCDKPPRAKQRYCKECHSRYMKAWRAKRRREEEELRAAVVRLRKTVVDQRQTIDELSA